MGEAPADTDVPTPCMLFEDADLLAVNKPAGLVTHPAYKHPTDTLCDAVFAYMAHRGEPRPWLLHRLDKETSGVVLFAKTETARRAVVRQFERRTVRKAYLAIVCGQVEEDVGLVEAPLRRDPIDRRRTIVDAAGQPSSTRFRVLARGGGATLVLAEPLTGRTHQIRAHLAHIGAPLLGDVRYLPAGHGAQTPAPRAMLHAWRLGVLRPGTGVPLSFTAPLPNDFGAVLDALHLSDGMRALGERIGY
jgi:23S rRNA pseudouridine1911/1915/1917 synthase